MTDIVERLRRPVMVDYRLHIEAADEITRLRAELAAVRAALREMIYETTHLSPLEDDGSHWCRITKDTLANARRALAERAP